MRDLPTHGPMTAPARPGVFADPRAFTVLGFLSAALAVLFVPLVFGAIAVACGVTAHRKGDPLGLPVAVGGVLAFTLGAALTVLVHDLRA